MGWGLWESGVWESREREEESSQHVSDWKSVRGSQHQRHATWEELFQEALGKGTRLRVESLQVPLGES